MATVVVEKEDVLVQPALPPRGDLVSRRIELRVIVCNGARAKSVYVCPKEEREGREGERAREPERENRSKFHKIPQNSISRLVGLRTLNLRSTDTYRVREFNVFTVYNKR